MNVLLTVAVLVPAVVVHEVAHGWAAWRLGDPTAREQGRLTLNPIRHIDPLGSIVVPLLLAMVGGFVFGWARPVPVDVRRLRDPRNHGPLVALAGPASNALQAILWAVGLGLIVRAMPAPEPPWMVQLAVRGLVINVLLGMFNLLPIPPLDGSWLAARFLPASARPAWGHLRRFGFLPLLAFLILANRTPLGAWLEAGFERVLRPFFALAQRIGG
ncbi:MAG TPA: site-2 protease family protein [Candidatus Krumholzibacteria bacterium]|nr:site-2 protease family protein [Candidatus Krumholzibacteria bacterium]HPD72124.1 site-2 protease family protein [Candidatus Krumholzibacteria bacterium]HRY40944.1 site-2 protease family protein [Candidatus Krumholzibacteria bacterium]